MSGALGTALAEAAEDPERFLERLADGARRALPGSAEVIELERARTLTDRLAGRPGRPVALKLSRAERVLSLRREGSRWAGEAARVVGGVVISRSALPLGRWLDAFASEVAVAAADDADDARAAGRALAALGLQPSEAEFAVDVQRLDQDLASLPARAEGRLPAEAVALVARIAALLREAAPRVGGSVEAEALVRRTASVYLPDTLRAFAALPPDWAGSRALVDGTGPTEALLSQLRHLEEGVTRMRDAAVEDDANALLLNGLFLAERFGPAPGQESDR